MTCRRAPSRRGSSPSFSPGPPPSAAYLQPVDASLLLLSRLLGGRLLHKVFLVAVLDNERNGHALPDRNRLLKAHLAAAAARPHLIAKRRGDHNDLVTLLDFTLALQPCRLRALNDFVDEHALLEILPELEAEHDALRGRIGLPECDLAITGLRRAKAQCITPLLALLVVAKEVDHLRRRSALRNRRLALRVAQRNSLVRRGRREACEKN